MLLLFSAKKMSCVSRQRSYQLLRFCSDGSASHRLLCTERRRRTGRKRDGRAQKKDFRKKKHAEDFKDIGVKLAFFFFSTIIKDYGANLGLFFPAFALLLQGGRRLRGCF